MKRSSLSKYKEIIYSIDHRSHEQNKKLEIYKCKVTLIDGSNLRIFEKYNGEELVYYSYYWLTSLNELIIGWDCAQHHKKLDNFPFHKHIGQNNKVISSTKMNLDDVLSTINKSFDTLLPQ